MAEYPHDFQAHPEPPSDLGPDVNRPIGHELPEGHGDGKDGRPVNLERKSASTPAATSVTNTKKVSVIKR